LDSRIRFALIAVCLVSAGTPAAKTLVKSIRAETTGQGSIEEALHIRKASGTFELNDKIPTARLAIEMYRNGEKVTTSEGIGLRGIPEQMTAAGIFSVQVIDLDYLKLGEPKPGHLRYVISLGLNQVVAGTTFDVPKGTFGGEGTSGVSAFNVAAGTEDEAPLGVMTLAARPDASGGHTIHGAGVTIADTVAASKHNDILVVKLVRAEAGR
jgi:hypothetical protein